MAKLDGLEAVLDFLKGLQPKIAAQLAKKVLALNIDPLPPDSKELKGYSDLFRVDSSEYRIVYCYLPQDDLAHNCIGVFNTSFNATHFVPELEKFKNQVPDYPYLGL
jgi:mRNA interferase RelE/StbE